MFTLEFLITSLVIVLIPGTGVIYTISTGILSGWKASLVAAFACTLGIIPHLLASILGLSAILHTSAIAFQIVKYIGVVYLLYLAWSMWRNTGSIFTDTENIQKTSTSKIMLKAIMINLLNPKLSIFFLAFLPMFVSKDSSYATGQMFILSFIFMLLTFIVFAIYGIFASRVRSYILNSPGIISRIQKSFAVMFALLGLKLMMEKE